MVKRRCSREFFIAAALLFILLLNVLVYFLVDTGIALNNQDSFSAAENNKIVKISYDNLHKKDEVKSIGNEKSSMQAKSSTSKKFYPAVGPNQLVASIKAAARVRAMVQQVENIYKNVSKRYEHRLSAILKDLMPTNRLSQDLWSTSDKWVTAQFAVPKSAPQLGSVLNTLCASKIEKADNSKKGTQLKIALTLEGGHQALFKPKWYKRDEVIQGSVYAGKDRHNAEVAAFHLSLLLNLRRVPLTVGRKIDLRREVMPVATPALRETFFQEGNNTCFYGVCLYCNPADPVCAKKDIMEGALILWLPTKITFARYAHPWQRSYRDTFVAKWEVEEDYCERVKKARPFASNSKHRLLDLVDAAIFDFLISNGDRHHYEAPINASPSTVFLFDNGKSFGDPHRDHVDILAPLYQCCILRRQTFEVLQVYQGGALSDALEMSMKSSHIAPVLTKDHLLSLDRRLLLVFAAAEVCFRDKGRESVLI